MTSNELAEAIAQRLQTVFPEGFHISARQSWVTIGRSPGHFETSTDVGTLYRDRANVEIPIRAVMSSAQDYVSEGLTVPWPPHDRKRHGLAYADAQVRVNGGRVEMWYGLSDRVDLALEPIEIDD